MTMNRIQLSPVSIGDPPPANSAKEFFNRELSWLAFNSRVLQQALDIRTPLLERVRFLSIYTSNLDEFFMKRVGGLKRQILAGIAGVSIDGMGSAAQLAAIRRTVLLQLQDQACCFTDEILPALKAEGIHLLEWHQLTEDERQFAQRYFSENVFPVVTPFAVDPGHPFPFISNLSVSLGVKLTHVGKDDLLFARVKIPDVFPHWLQLETDSDTPNQYRFVSLVQVIQHHLDDLFPGMQVLGVTPFRLTRSADIEVDDDDSEDLLELIENELKQRRFASIVRVEHGPNPDPWIMRFLTDELDLAEADAYELPAELDYCGLQPIIDLPLAHLKFEPWTPVAPPILAGEDTDIFNVIRAGDMLVHHPYESFSASVERLIHVAADDPKVLAIKITLYRIGESRPLMDSLMRAAELGKQVICLVELKARFDEQRNIYWAQQLEKAGVHVVYGLVGLKTHTKLTLVVRQEVDGVRCYTHIGTGNYNVQTARLYTDLGLFTCRQSITREVVELFHYLTGRSTKADYTHLLVAPSTMRQRFLDLIQTEINNHQAGQPAGIIGKMNSLEDRKVIRALYHASQQGVPVHLIIRGFCCLRPGVKGLSDNIRVTSIIGRFLEHSRIFYFRSGAQQEADGQFFIGSADWMYRNMSNRVEVIAPVEDAACRQKLWQIIQIMLDDHRRCWDLHPDGSYAQRQPLDDNPLGTHERLMRLTLEFAGRDPDEQAMASHTPATKTHYNSQHSTNSAFTPKPLSSHTPSSSDPDTHGHSIEPSMKTEHENNHESHT